MALGGNIFNNLQFHGGVIKAWLPHAISEILVAFSNRLAKPR
jgi:hypothetical protein